MAIPHVGQRKTVDYIMKLSKHLLSSVSGGVIFLLTCRGNHLPVR